MGLQPANENRIYFLCFGEADHKAAWEKYIRTNILAFADEAKLSMTNSEGKLLDPSYVPIREYVP